MPIESGLSRPTEGLNDRVYRALKNEILLCRLPPGAEISEGMLTTPLRVQQGAAGGSDLSVHTENCTAHLSGIPFV